MMSEVQHTVIDLIGNTPLLELEHLEQQYNLGTHFLAKLEFFNPGGSVKDRIAKSMIEDAEEKGLLKPGDTIIEPTSGNTGIGLAMVAAYKGYRIILIMPASTSAEHQKLLEAYGAEVVLTDSTAGVRASIAKAEELAASTPRSFIPGQFINPANPAAHFASTGPEIWRQTVGKVDIFVAGAGTGGTITGIGKYLKSQNPDVIVIAVEPAGSPFLSEGKSGYHRLQGIGAGFIPQVFDTKVLDEVITVADEDAFAISRELVRTEGLLVGASSGAAAWAALQVARHPQNNGKTIVALFPDTGERYISSQIFQK
jgi:cysteine synthase A